MDDGLIGTREARMILGVPATGRIMRRSLFEDTVERKGVEPVARIGSTRLWKREDIQRLLGVQGERHDAAVEKAFGS